jgi:hypothetical protein
MKPRGDKESLITRRFWSVVAGALIFVAGLWVFSFTVYRIPLTNNGVDGLVAGPLPLAALMGGIIGGAFEYFLERRSCHK